MIERSSDDPGREGDGSSREGTRSELSGNARDVIQARSVSGGVHFHGSAATSKKLPHQLPGDVRNFVNRVADLGRLDSVLSQGMQDLQAATACVIVGTAGVGKTSLAVHWAHLVRDRFPDGQLYVNLRGYDPGAPVTAYQALDRFLKALHVTPGEIPSDLDDRTSLFRSIIADRRLLILLDNAATVGQVRPLLPGTSESLVLITSRSRLSGLVARNGAYRITVETLPEEEAVNLLRATTSSYRFEDRQEDLQELARLCARLPLALRIAAERAASRPHMPLSELIRDLQDESELWEALSVENDEEADAVRTVFAWSYRALTEDAARLFRLLGLHPGPDFRGQAAAALADIPVGQTRHLLDALTGAHLLEQTMPDRYKFHDLLRAYASDQAHSEESGDDQIAARRRVLEWYLHTAASAPLASALFIRQPVLDPLSQGVALPRLSSHSEAVDWYKSEWENLSTAIRMAKSSGLGGIAWKLFMAQYRLNDFVHSIDDMMGESQIALEAARQAQDLYGEAEVLHIQGIIFEWGHHQISNALSRYQASLEIRQEIRDQVGQGISLNYIGFAHAHARRFLEAEPFYRRAIALFESCNDRSRLLVVERNLATIAFNLGRFEEAKALCNGTLGEDRAAGMKFGELASLRIIAQVSLATGDFAEALRISSEIATEAQGLSSPLYEGSSLILSGEAQCGLGSFEDALISFHRSATLYRQLGIRVDEAVAINGAGRAYYGLGRLQDAISFHRRSVAVCRECDERWHLARSLNDLAMAVAASGDNDEAQQFWAEALSLLGHYNDPQAVLLLQSVTSSLAAPGESSQSVD
ncbi:tetratricopeptide repeat protein [Kitasatospora sp. NPDC048540]|uniref:ATP-binding protein n=1 Tax=Kitasatospora sp. NPDC048540 TaxID=3155634 RepID=UPI0033C336EE